jgi:hypothetical protein
VIAQGTVNENCNVAVFNFTLSSRTNVIGLNLSGSFKGALERLSPESEGKSA